MSEADLQPGDNRDSRKFDFRVVSYGTKIPKGYSITTCEVAEKNLTTIMYNSSVFFYNNEQHHVRLKDGLLTYKGVFKFKYEEKVAFKLICEQTSGERMLSNAENLIALAYAAEHDDLEEVRELVLIGGEKLLRTRMPFAHLGTILHICIHSLSLQTLTYLASAYHEIIDVYIFDKEGEAALHNFDSNWHAPEPYDLYRRAVTLLLDLPELQTNRLLSVQSERGQMTALCKALVYQKRELCKALLDAAKKKKSEGPVFDTASPHWLEVKATGWLVGFVYGLGDKEIASHTSKSTGSLNCTALHLAVLRQYPEIVTKILKPCPDVISCGDHDGNSPLHVAARIGNAKICMMLLKYGVDRGGVTSVNKEGQTPLQIASHHGHAEVCEKLLDYGASMSSADYHGRYALTQAFARGHTDTVRKLLEACIPPVASSLKEHNGALPSSFSVIPVKAQPSSSSYTNPNASLVNEHFECGLTPLHVAVGISSLTHVEELIKNGALIDSRSNNDKTPLHIAAEQCNEKSVEALLWAAGGRWHGEHDERKIQWINTRDVKGQTALHKVLSAQCTKAARAIAESKSSAEEITGAESDKVMENIQLEIVKKLLREGAWVDVQDGGGDTCLHTAVQFQSYDKIVETLLISGESQKNLQPGKVSDRDKWISLCNFSGETALHAAARACAVDTVYLLLLYSQSCNNLLLVRDMEDRTAFEWAVEHKDQSMMKKMMDSVNDHISAITQSLLQHRTTRKRLDPAQEIQLGELQASSHLLEDAIRENIARGLTNGGGADITALDSASRRWLPQKFRFSASDEPTPADTLGCRKELVQGLATFLINPLTETPITIGIFGEFGAGKTSFMLQVESAMVCMIVQETLRKSCNSVNKKKCSSIEAFSRSGFCLRRRKKNDVFETTPFKLHSNDGKLLESLALMDKSKVVRSDDESWIKKKIGLHDQEPQDAQPIAQTPTLQSIAQTPTLLSMRFNAWKKDEVVNALVKEITHNIESHMTPDQWLRMCFLTALRDQPWNVFQIRCYFMLKILVFIAVTCIVWVELPHKYAGFSYIIFFVMGFALVLALCRDFFKMIHLVAKSKMRFAETGARQNMKDYQNQAIAELNFRKQQVCGNRRFVWMILGIIVSRFLSQSFFIEGTKIIKRHPFPKNFRIVVFIDDLDKCDEETILELLRAVNIILGSCGISTVIAADKDLVHRAMTSIFLKIDGEKCFDIWLDHEGLQEEVDDKFLEKNDENAFATCIDIDKSSTQSKYAKNSQNVDSSRHRNSKIRELVENYMEQIFQLPIHLPHPNEKEIQNFVQAQVGDSCKYNLKECHQQETHDGSYDPTIFPFRLISYTSVETDLLKKLCQVRSKEKSLPREWKRFLTYHCLARTILSQDTAMKSDMFRGWQRKLILWIFVCWKWRSQMDVIFLKWNELSSKALKVEEETSFQLEHKTQRSSLILSKVVLAYVHSKNWSVLENVTEEIGGQGNENIPETWNSLYSTLKEEYDIPVCFIKKFQVFRFHCELNQLKIGDY